MLGQHAELFLNVCNDQCCGPSLHLIGCLIAELHEENKPFKVMFSQQLCLYAKTWMEGWLKTIKGAKKGLEGKWRRPQWRTTTTKKVISKIMILHCSNNEHRQVLSDSFFFCIHFHPRRPLISQKLEQWQWLLCIFSDFAWQHSMHRHSLYFCYVVQGSQPSFCQRGLWIGGRYLIPDKSLKGCSCCSF